MSKTNTLLGRKVRLDRRVRLGHLKYQRRLLKTSPQQFPRTCTYLLLSSPEVCIHHLIKQHDKSLCVCMSLPVCASKFIPIKILRKQCYVVIIRMFHYTAFKPDLELPLLSVKYIKAFSEDFYSDIRRTTKTGLVVFLIYFYFFFL